MNRMLNLAVQEYVRRRRQQHTKTLEATLTKLRDYAEADPGYEGAIAAFTESEGASAAPVEGTLVLPAEA